MRILSLFTVLALAACSLPAPHSSDAIPPDLVPSGFTAADCRITDPGGPLTEPGADGRPVTVGTRPPQILCHHHSETQQEALHTASCRTSSGKELPLTDCCMNPDGSKIAACTPKLQTPGP